MREPTYTQPLLLLDGSAAAAPITTKDDAELSVVRTDRVDYGTTDESGQYDYSYAFATYEVRVGARSLRARRYTDTWQHVSIFRGDDPIAWTGIPYADRALCTVARYFFASTTSRRSTRSPPSTSLSMRHF